MGCVLGPSHIDVQPANRECLAIPDNCPRKPGDYDSQKFAPRTSAS